MHACSTSRLSKLKYSKYCRVSKSIVQATKSNKNHLKLTSMFGPNCMTHHHQVAILSCKEWWWWVSPNNAFVHPFGPLVVVSPNNALACQFIQPCHVVASLVCVGHIDSGCGCGDVVGELCNHNTKENILLMNINT